MGQSRRREGFFGPYTEHTDEHGEKSGESRERDGFFGRYTEHVDERGNKVGESREQEGFFGRYTEHVDERGNKVGESREQQGLFGPYTEHSGNIRHSKPRREGDDASVLGELIIKAVVGLFALLLVFVSWRLWLSMILVAAVLSAVVARSISNGGWAATLDERLGGRAHMVPPGIPILGGLLFIIIGGNGIGGMILLGIVVLGGGFACVYVSRWIFGLERNRAVRGA